MIIDAHQHFWHYDPITYNWIDDDMAMIRRDFLPPHFLPIAHENNITGTVVVQSEQTEAQTYFKINLATKFNFIKGVVAWVDLKANNLDERLAHFQSFNIVKGFRHILQGEDPEFMLESTFLKGIAALKNFNFTYDILIFPKHLRATIELVKKNPNQLFVINHVAKPYIKAGLIDDWQKDIQLIAKFENVYCKVSGLATEADYKKWTVNDLIPYMDIAVNAFGSKRIMFGSNWPVCLTTSSYKENLILNQNYFSKFSQTEQDDFFGNNAVKFYNLIL